ncbi:Mho1p [Saccharomyces cerevisiae YJM1129]|nr:Mho1p [Saccharomyces cerevisiae YJM1129]AJR73789.1 Mho1p [Saccharomyces cerevisiae YJM1526]
MSIRPATHAGSWYSNRAQELSQQLHTYLIKSTLKGPIHNARIIICPHAGYRYCGPTMAYSYASLDLNRNVKRIFILGPSHHIYFKNQILVSAFSELETPLGNLKMDTDLCKTLIQKEYPENGKKLFKPMDHDTDMAEHSLEMQLPMLVETLKWREISLDTVKVIPMMVSHNSVDVDRCIGNILSEYIKDPNNLFIVSSDFCHWGRRFQYTGYVGSKEELNDAIQEETEVEMLTARSKLSHHQVPIWQSIEIMDRYAMKTLSDTPNGERYDAWKQYLEITGNTICGEKPISVILSALSKIRDAGPSGIKFQWPNYSQSSHVTSIDDSSVSYTSGYVTIG